MLSATDLTPIVQTPIVQARGLTVAHGTEVVLRDISFEITAGEVFVIVGASGCGKSSLLRDLIGLQPPAQGQVLIEGQDLYQGDETQLRALRRRFGVMFQAGALWSAMSVGENLMLPMQLFTPWPSRAREQRARLKLALVGLEDAFDLMPAQLSGGMRKRAALARALALDPALVFLDEPGSGLDPVNAARLDTLILQLRAQLGTTVVMVTHEIDSVFAVADRVLFLDEVDKTMTALDRPQALLQSGPARVREFLQRGAAHRGAALTTATAAGSLVIGTDTPPALAGTRA
jgi:phospholipid/cholesterol/gamma-HCH transport system ATP-binding protein